MDQSITNSPFPHHSEPPFVNPFITPRTRSRLRNPTAILTAAGTTTRNGSPRSHRTLTTPLSKRLSQPSQGNSSPHYAQETIASAAKRRFREEEEADGMGEGIPERIAVLEAEIRMLREQRGWIVGMIKGQKKGTRILGRERDSGSSSSSVAGKEVIVVNIDDYDDGKEEDDFEVVRGGGGGD